MSDWETFTCKVLSECFVFSVMCLYLWYVIALNLGENIIWELVLKSIWPFSPILPLPALHKTQESTGHNVCCTMETFYYSKAKHWKLWGHNQVIVAIKSVLWDLSDGPNLCSSGQSDKNSTLVAAASFHKCAQLSCRHLENTARRLSGTHSKAAKQKRSAPMKMA